MRKLKLILLLSICLGLTIIFPYFCSPGDDIVDSDSDSDGDSDTDSDSDGDSDDPITVVTVTIQGRVWSPGKVVPIAGALVYLYHNLPSPIPNHVYCEECVELPSTIPHAKSNPDGTFRIENVPIGRYYIITHKGQFRTVVPIEVEGNQGDVLRIPEEYTTLPDKDHFGGNDSLPNIAVATGSFDQMQDILAKINLATLDSNNTMVDDGTQVFDLYYNGGRGRGQYEDFEDLVRDINRMKQYHIIFIPCSNGFENILRDAEVRNNIREYVHSGGKWYVADWSYDWVEQVFPEFLDFGGDDEVINANDDLSFSYDSQARVVDETLAQWIASLGHNPNNIEILENWDWIEGMGQNIPTGDRDANGNPILVTPKVWVEGPVEALNNRVAPLTVTWEFGCGKVLYTTYHTVGYMGESHSGLLPQEQILVFLSMEIGVCLEEIPVW